MFQRTSSSFAVAFSLTVCVAFMTLCSAGTIQNRPAAAIPTAQNQNTGKTPARRVMHPAFVNAGKTAGLEIWRIEDFEPVAYPKNNYGKFFTGDSFIILNTQQLKNKQFVWDVHFWLGSETSTDEAGAAAILTVQLDDSLNGAPVQHREVQDHESQLFMSYFKNGIRYEKGGVGSGFRHVQTNAEGEKRLFQVKGKRNVRVRQVNLSVSSMNKGDCFILDAGNDIYVYVGAQAKRVEKLKAISAANQIRDQDHNGRAKVNIIDEFSTDVDQQNFFTVLGSGSPKDVPEESAAEEDAAFETADERTVTLYKVSDQGGKLKIDPVSSKPLRQETLDTQDCFILDTGSGIFVWVGKRATQQEKSQAMAKAQEFLTTKKYPAWTQVHRIVEGAESAPFKQYFATWKDVGMSHTRLIRSAMGYGSDIADEDIDTSAFDALKKSGGSAIGFMPDNADRGISKVWQVVVQPDSEEPVIREVEDISNILLGFCSYVIEYNYLAKNGEQGVVVYIWEGHSSPLATHRAAFKLGMERGDELNAIVVRTTQGHEPRHFLKLFQGKLISSFSKLPIKPQLFHIRGTDDTDVRANEVKCDTEFLASDDVFALVKPSDRKVYIWVGLGASDFEQEMAKSRFGHYWKSFDSEIIEEGAEPDDFWEDLNGEGIYDRSVGKSGAPLLEPRLFHCRIMINGKMRVEEISNFEQADLDVDDVMLLDGGDEIYVWVGEGTTPEEKQSVLQMAKEYIRHDPTDRTINTVSVVKLNQSHEPTCFKNIFPTWDDEFWKSIPTYEDVKKQIEEDNERLENNDVL